MQISFGWNYMYMHHTFHTRLMLMSPIKIDNSLSFFIDTQLFYLMVALIGSFCIGNRSVGV